MTEFVKAFLNGEYSLCETLLHDRYPDIPSGDIAEMIQKLKDKTITLEWFETFSDEWAQSIAFRDDRKGRPGEMSDLSLTYYAGDLDGALNILRGRYPGTPDEVLAIMLTYLFFKNIDILEFEDELGIWLKKVRMEYERNGWKWEQ